MSKITRATQLIFGSTAGADQIERFGSLASGLPVYLTPDNGGVAVASIQSLSNYLTGWFGGVVGSNAPSIQDLNALCYLFAYQIAYNFQAGIPEWDAGTTYYTGSFVNSAGVIYVSKIDSNLNNAVSNTTDWKVFWNNPFTTLGDMVYSAANGVPTRLAGNTTTVKQFLSQTGTGSASAIPVLSRLQPTQQTFTSSSGTYTTPAGCTRIRVRMVGGGGGGGGCASTSAGQNAAAGGGGGGGYFDKMIYLPSATYAYVVGAGGAGGTAGANNGVDGTSSSFGPGGGGALAATGGSKGTGTAATSTGNISTSWGAGGVGQNGDINSYGGNGLPGIAMPSGGPCVGGQGGGTVLSPVSSFNQPVGGATQATGQNGSVYGQGGQGGASVTGGTSAAGGAGVNGIIIVDEFYD